MVEGGVVDSNMNSFSGNLFAVLIYYLEVGDGGLGADVWNAVFVNCTVDMTIVVIVSLYGIGISQSLNIKKSFTVCCKSGQAI